MIRVTVEKHKFNDRAGKGVTDDIVILTNTDTDVGVWFRVFKNKNYKMSLEDLVRRTVKETIRVLTNTYDKKTKQIIKDKNRPKVIRG